MRSRLIFSSMIVAFLWSAEVSAATRTVTGTLYRPNDTVWAGGALTIQLLETFSNAGQTVVPQTWRATANAAGVVTVSILVPDVGAARYVFTLPDGTAVEVTLGVGATVLLETIFTTGLSDPTASTTLADLITSLAVALSPATSARNVVQPSADVVPFTVAARVAGQTANLTEWKNTAGTVVASVSPTGALTGLGLGVGVAGWINVKDYGAIGDGVADDTAAISTAKATIGASGGVLYFPPGIYLVTGTGILLNKSNMTFRGAGMFQSILKRSSALHIMQPSGVVSNIAVEDLGFNASDAVSGTQINFSRYSTGFRISRCWFSHIGGGSAITLTGSGPLIIEDNFFQGNGQGLGTSISIGGGSHDVVIRGNKFWYVDNGVIIDTGTAATQTTEVSEYITIEDNDFDLGWFLLPARFSGSGGAVTYTSTVLTDTGAAFSGVIANDHVRVMPVKQTGTGAFQNTNTKVTDTSATFVTNLVRRGDILKTGTAFGVVRAVESETILWVEDWLSDTDRSPVAIPAGGAYTIYGVILGKVTATTATTVSVVRWHDFDHNNPLPSAGTRYEVQYNRCNYAINAERGARYLKILNNRVKRGYSDQVSVYGYSSDIIGNTIEDGQDMGITLHGQDNIVSNNRIIHQGAGGIFTTASNSIIDSNLFSNSPWENAAVGQIAHIMAASGESDGLLDNTILSNNRFVRGTTTQERYAIVFWSYGLGTATNNVVRGNVSTGMLVADYRVEGTGNVGTKFIDNIGTLSLTNGATVGDQRGQYGAPTIAGCGSGATVTSGSSDTTGSLTVGTTPGTCVVTFKAAWSVAPICLVQNQTSAQLARATAVSGTSLTVGGTIVASDVVSWHCQGKPF